MHLQTKCPDMLQAYIGDVGKHRPHMIQSARPQLNVVYDASDTAYHQDGLSNWPDVWYAEQYHLHQDQLIIHKDDNNPSFQDTSQIWHKVLTAPDVDWELYQQPY